ncbi:hypothetical protein Tco_0748855 [Tanacetum coccineum]|uniref:Zinc finger GRF-type domain-containing protein n=1 Tax=Tanacetum coccineum TaxID=301880 RepID=A0ABQ4YWT3_9ASTR
MSDLIKLGCIKCKKWKCVVTNIYAEITAMVHNTTRGWCWFLSPTSKPGTTERGCGYFMWMDASPGPSHLKVILRELLHVQVILRELLHDQVILRDLHRISEWQSAQIQWRTAYPGAYSALETIADDPQNITSQVRQLIIMEDPYRGSTDEQDRAYRDLKCAKIEISCCRCNIVSLKVKTNGKFGKKEMKVQLILHRWMYKY